MTFLVTSYWLLHLRKIVISTTFLVRMVRYFLIWSCWYFLPVFIFWQCRFRLNVLLDKSVFFISQVIRDLFTIFSVYFIFQCWYFSILMADLFDTLCLSSYLKQNIQKYDFHLMIMMQSLGIEFDWVMFMIILVIVVIFWIVLDFLNIAHFL